MNGAEDAAKVERDRFLFTLVAGTVAGLVAGSIASLALFEVLEYANFTRLGYILLVVVRGIVLGAGGGGGAGLMCVVKPRPFGPWVAALAGTICGSVAIFLPFPFHLPNEVMDLLMEPNWRGTP